MKCIKYFSLLFSLVAITSCSGNFEDIFSPIVEIELPPHTSKLVIFANFEADSDSLVVHLTRSRSALDTVSRRVFVRNDTFGIFNGKLFFRPIFLEVDSVKNAKVELFRNDVLWGTFKDSTFGRYILRKKLPNDGATYRIRAELSGFVAVEATQKMPVAAKLDSVRYVPNGAVVQELLSSRKSNEYTYFFNDPATVGSYYYVQATHFDTAYRRTNGERKFSPQSLDRLAQSNFLSDVSFNGKTYLWRNYDDNVFSLRRGTRTEHTLVTASSELFQFIRSKELNEAASGNPFAEPVILYSNIKNGYGIFSLSASSTWIKRY
jgi:Domain of unknown function (DUF4249)